MRNSGCSRIRAGEGVTCVACNEPIGKDEEAFCRPDWDGVVKHSDGVTRKIAAALKAIDDMICDCCGRKGARRSPCPTCCALTRVQEELKRDGDGKCASG